MKKFIPFTITNVSSGAIKLTEEQSQQLFLGLGDSIDEVRGQLESFGSWQIPLRYKALRISGVFAPKYSGRHYDSYTVYGPGTLTKLHQSGHELEGRVSINGRKVRGFTSSQLFELPSGHLVNVAVIFACLNQKESEE